MGAVISGAGGKAAKARAAATRTNGSLSFSRATSFSVVSRRSSLSSGWTRARAQRLVVLSIASSLLALARIVASASLGICPSCAEHERGGRAGVLIAQQGRDLRHGRRGGLAHRAQGEHGLAANLRPLVLELLRDRRNRIFGRGADVAEDDQGPEGGLVVLQGFDQRGHGLDAAFRNGVRESARGWPDRDPPASWCKSGSSLSGRGEWP